MIQIIPAILTDSSIKFKDLVLRIEPYSKRVHLDIADGEFVPNKTITGYDDIMQIETALKFDIHLMVKLPEVVMKEWMHTHAERFIVHIEAVADFEKFINDLHAIGKKVGIAINPETPVENLEPLLMQADFVQFMTVHPGFQGGEFVSEVVDKISAFHSKYPDIMIMADGAITPETAPLLVKAGASELVAGSYIIKSDNIEKAVGRLKEASEK